MSDRRKRERSAKTNPMTKCNEPIQLTIAAYGKKKRSGSLETENVDNTVTSSSSSEEEESPIVLSLPVSDAMEAKFDHQHTLDDELTSYRPDIEHLLHQPAPLAMVSGSEGHPLQNQKTGANRLTVKRCPVCVDKAGPCDACRAKFNQNFTRSLSDYQSAREQQDKLFGNPDPALFQNVTIADKPLPKDFKPPIYHHRSGMEVVIDARELADQPQGYTEAGWELADIEQHTLTQEQREQYQQQELDILRHKVVKLEEMIASVRHSGSATSDAPFGRECMWHMGSFDTVPVGLPLHYDAATGVFDTIGCFCSLQCAYAYRLEHRSAEAAPLHLLFKAHRMIQAEEREKSEESEARRPPFLPLVPAPPRQALKRWGGAMELDEFLSKSQVWHALARYPFVPTTEFIATSSSQSFARGLPRAGKNTTTGDGLVRRRNKPHPNAANQWNNAVRRSRLRRGT